jgi:hypothetical protein
MARDMAPIICNGIVHFILAFACAKLWFFIS